MPRRSKRNSKGEMDSAKRRDLYERRFRDIELKMGELRSALQEVSKKYKELESVVEESRSLVSDSGLGGEEPEQESGAQGTSAGRKRASTSAGGRSKRQSKSSEEEPPRKMRHASRRASGEKELTPTEALHLAAEKGDVETVREMIAKATNSRYLNEWTVMPLDCSLALWNAEMTSRMPKD